MYTPDNSVKMQDHTLYTKQFQSADSRDFLQKFAWLNMTSEENKHGGGLLSSAGCSCVCTNRKTKEKVVNEVMTEKLESTLLIHLASQAGGVASQSARSHWQLQVSAQYCITVTFTLQDFNSKSRNIKTMSVNPSHYRMILADNLFRSASARGQPCNCQEDTNSVHLSTSVGPD